ncbi:MAG: hypothetical protein WCJ72_09895 [Chryseobacterium sp.]
MKQKDLVTIIFISLITAGFSFLVSNLLFGGTKSYNLTAPQVTPITDQFTLPNSLYFNGNSVDLTQIITIGNAPSTTNVK